MWIILPRGWLAKLVLDMLGVEVEAYFASEIDPDALMVSRVRHMDSITHIGDVTSVDMERVRKHVMVDWCICGTFVENTYLGPLWQEIADHHNGALLTLMDVKLLKNAWMLPVCLASIK